MRLDRYELRAGDNLTAFEFTSEGIKGKITKIIEFTETNYENIFNISFGDKDFIGGMDDMIVSNNRDREKVLATVVATIYDFTNKNPNAWIYATGSTRSRNRLYRMGISKFLEEAKTDFEILGRLNDEWEFFVKDVDYDAFLVKRKFNTFVV